MLYELIIPTKQSERKIIIGRKKSMVMVTFFSLPDDETAKTHAQKFVANIARLGMIDNTRSITLSEGKIEGKNFQQNRKIDFTFTPRI